jgi:hypothetical protein
MLAASCHPIPAQTLARPGWAGSGLAPEAWYQRAVFYRIETPANMPTEAQLPSLQAFGIDALLLTAEDLRTTSSAAADVAPAADATPAVASALPLSMDDLLFECSRLHMRVFVPLDLTRPGTEVLALARSWLYRGAGGFILRNLPHTSQPDAAQPDGLQQNAKGTAAMQATKQNIRQDTTKEAKPSPAVHSLHLPKANADAPIVAALHLLLLSFPGSRLLVADGIPLTPSIQLQVLPLAASPATPQAVLRQLLTLGDGALTPVGATRLLATPYPAMISSAALTPAQLSHVFSAAPIDSAALTNAETEQAAPAAPPPPSNVYGAYKPYVPKDTATERRKEAEAKVARERAEQIAADTFPVQPTYESIASTPEAQIAFYHRLIQLHRAKTTGVGSTLSPLETDTPDARDAPTAAVTAWSVHRTGMPDIVVVCNPNDSQQRVALRTRQTLRTLLHTAAASGVESTNALLVGPHGVYIGQVLGR